MGLSGGRMESEHLLAAGKGAYLGTEINGKWWRRFRKAGFFARGNGEYWLDDTGLFFHRLLTRDPLHIPLEAMDSLKIGKWHGGRWLLGHPVLKVLWSFQGERLSSGFSIHGGQSMVEHVRTLLERLIRDRWAQRASLSRG